MRKCLDLFCFVIFYVFNWNDGGLLFFVHVSKNLLSMTKNQFVQNSFLLIVFWHFFLKIFRKPKNFVSNFTKKSNKIHIQFFILLNSEFFGTSTVNNEIFKSMSHKIHSKIVPKSINNNTNSLNTFNDVTQNQNFHLKPTNLHKFTTKQNKISTIL